MYGPDPVPAIAAVELALPQAQRLLGPAPLIEYLPDPYTGEIVPIMLVTDNGGPFHSFRFSALITSRPELRHVRTRVRSLGQNDVRACLRLTRVRAALPRADDDPLDLVRETEAFRVELNTVRPHEALARTLSADVHVRLADLTIPTSEATESCQPFDAGHWLPGRRHGRTGWGPAGRSFGGR
jgi:transposase InsO family protein